MIKSLRQELILKKTAKILAGKNIKVDTEGFAPRVEYNVETKLPERVVLPQLPEDVDDRLINAIHGYIDHEVGHILESSADHICDKTKDKLWKYIHNCIEDPRINNYMAERYHGSEANIRSGYNYIYDMKAEGAEHGAYSKEAIDSIDLSNEDAVKEAQARYAHMWFARKAKCRFSSDKYDEIGLDKLFDPLEKKMEPKWVEELSSISSKDDAFQASNYFSKFFHKEFEEGSGGGGEEEGGSGGKGKFSDKFKKVEDELAEAIESSVVKHYEGTRQNWHFSSRFDVEYDKLTIIKNTPSSLRSKLEVPRFEEEVKGVTNYISKDLRRLLEARNRRWYTGGYKSGKLNQKALHSVKVGNDRIFSKKNDIKEVKAAVSLLIDLSGSMSGQKVRVALMSAYAFAMSLEQLKVPYEVWGFNTSGTDSTKKMKEWARVSKTLPRSVIDTVINTSSHDLFFKFKGFEEHFDFNSKMSMVSAASGGVSLVQNEDSVHVLAAIKRLALRPEDKKTLFVFSDGQPAYNQSSHTSQQMLRHLDKVAKPKYGVDIFGIGIQTTSVEKYYQNRVVINDLKELPVALFDIMKTRI